MNRERIFREMEMTIEAQSEFFALPVGKRLLAFVAELNPVALENCFFLNHIVDQCEDYFVLIVNGEELFTVSIDRQTDDIILEGRELKPPQWQGGGLGRDAQARVKLARQKRNDLRARLAQEAIDADDQW